MLNLRPATFRLLAILLAVLILLLVVALVLSLVALTGRPAAAGNDAGVSLGTSMAWNVGAITDKTGNRTPELMARGP